jgi:uncharacterized protein (TIGR02996 family)
MDEEAFFLVVESSRKQARDVQWASELALSARLSALTDEELAGFQSLYFELGSELEDVESRGRSLHDLVEEAWGGCSDDSFLDFRSWVLWRGRETYEAVLADPEGFLAQGQGDRYGSAIWSPIHAERRRRALSDEVAPAQPDRALWDRRALAELRLEQGDLPAAWRQHEDRYVRALAWLAHPPSPDPELFDSPLRAAVYLAAARTLRDDDLEPLSALLWLDERAPRRELAPLLREALAPRLQAALAPYQEVLRNLVQEETDPEASRQAREILQALRAGAAAPFAGASAAALYREAAGSGAWSREALGPLAREPHPLAAAVIAGLMSQPDEQSVREMRWALRDSVPGGHLALARCAGEELGWRERLLWSELREAFDSPLAVLACRLDALGGSGSLSRHDPLRLPQQMLGSGPWVMLADLTLREHPLLRIVTRWLVSCSAGWLEAGVRDQQRFSERDPREVRAHFSRLLGEVAAEVGARNGLSRPLEPLEAELLRALEAGPAERAPQLVYADWCAQAGLAPRDWRLQRALEQAASGEGPLSRLDAALALGRLGLPSNLDVLLEALSSEPKRRAEIVGALWAFGEAAMPVLPALGSATMGELALRVRLQPEEPGEIEALLEQVPSAMEDLPGKEEWFREGLITRAELDDAVSVVRRSLQALARVAQHHPALRPRLQALAATLSTRPMADRFVEELRALSG